MSMDERYLSESSVIQAVGDIHPLDYNGQGMVERIKAIPAADVVEVRHAQWIEDGYFDEPCVCSNCGEPCKDTVMGKPRWNYCPNCGAKMDGKSADYAPAKPYDLLYEEGGPDA